MTEPETFLFADDGAVPNSRLPLLVYRRAVPADADAIERIFTENAWPAAWRAPVFPFHHFHSDAHEVLGIAAGEARVRFGGPRGEVLTVRAGDVVVIPAGVGHCRESPEGGTVIVGAYPANTPARDLRRANPAEHAEVTRNIEAVPPPPTDPIAGHDGPLVRLWGGAAVAAPPAGGFVSPAGEFSGFTGEALIAAMRSSPAREIDLAPGRAPLPVRDVSL
jgi:uncharacterized protein YjlB